MDADALAQPESGEEFNLYRCDVPEYPDAWVRFKLTGYPFKLRRQIDEAANDSEIMQLILPRVEAWLVNDAAGNAMPAPVECLAEPEKLGELEDALLYWLVRVFYNFWRVRLVTPRKN